MWKWWGSMMPVAPASSLASRSAPGCERVGLGEFPLEKRPFVAAVGVDEQNSACEFTLRKQTAATCKGNQSERREAKLMVSWSDHSWSLQAVHCKDISEKC